MLDVIESSEIDPLLENINTAFSKIEDVRIRKELDNIKHSLEEMKVAAMEIENLENQFQRGNITSDTYFEKHKKLVRDYVVTKNEIVDIEIENIQEIIESERKFDEKPNIRGVLKDNKGFILNLGLFIMDLIRFFGIH